MVIGRGGTFFGTAERIASKFYCFGSLRRARNGCAHVACRKTEKKKKTMKQVKVARNIWRTRVALRVHLSSRYQLLYLSASSSPSVRFSSVYGQHLLLTAKEKPCWLLFQFSSRLLRIFPQSFYLLFTNPTHHIAV